MFKKFVAILSAVLLAVLCLVPMTGASADTTMYVSASNGLSVNVRDLPAKSGTSLVQLGVGFPVKVVGTASGWSQVTFKVNGKTINGYMDSSFLSGSDPSTKAQSFKSVSAFTVTVRPVNANGFVNLRAAASVKSTSLRKMYSGEALTVIAASNAWYRVQDAYGNTAYVAKAYVKK